MVLSTRHRTSIYHGLTTILGEEEAGALMSEFPATEHDELVTRQYLRAEIAELRTEMHQEFANVRTEIAQSTTRVLIVCSTMLVGGLTTGMAAAAGIATAVG